MLMSALHSASAFLGSLHGTVFSNVFNRAMGARVGRNACLMTDSLESDLLTVDDGASINSDCDITCHTVENMVLKLAPVRIGETGYPSELFGGYAWRSDGVRIHAA